MLQAKHDGNVNDCFQEAVSKSYFNFSDFRFMAYFACRPSSG